MTLYELAEYMETFDECGRETRKWVLAAAAACRELHAKRVRDSGCSRGDETVPLAAATDAALEACK